MSERDLELIKVQKKIKDNNTKLKTAHQDAVLAEVYINNYESQIEYQTKLYNDIVNKFRLEINDAVENAKLLHDNLERLLKEKEELHAELKTASHYGMVQCEHCQNYFTEVGLTRHQKTCSGKAEVKIDKQHDAEVKEIEADIEARKAALKKELAALDKKESKKPKPIIPTIEELELLAAEEAQKVLAEQIARKKAGNGIQKVLDEHVEE